MKTNLLKSSEEALKNRGGYFAKFNYQITQGFLNHLNRYAATVLLLLCLGVGNAWGTSATITIGNSNSSSYAATFTSSSTNANITAGATAFSYISSKVSTSSSTDGAATAPYSIKFKSNGNINTSNYLDGYSISASFKVALGYTFTPTSISTTIVPEAASYSYKAILTDGVTTYTSSEISSSAKTPATFVFPSLSGTGLKGDVIFKIMFKSTANNSKWFIVNLPITIVGDVANDGGTPPSTSADTPGASGTIYFKDWITSATNDRLTANTTTYWKDGIKFYQYHNESSWSTSGGWYCTALKVFLPKYNHGLSAGDNWGGAHYSISGLTAVKGHAFTVSVTGPCEIEVVVHNNKLSWNSNYNIYVDDVAYGTAYATNGSKDCTGTNITSSATISHPDESTGRYVVTVPISQSFFDDNNTNGVLCIKFGSSVSGWGEGSLFFYESVTVTPAPTCTAPTAVYVTQTAGTADLIAGESFTLSAATSTGVEDGATYQWYRGDTPVGTNSPTYTVNSCTSTDAGTYWCKITNPCSEDAHTTNVTGYGIKVWQVLLYSSSWNAYNLTSTGTKTGETTAQLAPGTYYVKLTHNNGVDFGVGTGGSISEISATTPSAWTLYNGQNNIKLTVTTAGTYTFGVNYTSADNPTLSVTYPSATISGCDKIYFCPTQNSIATGSAKFSIYFWNDTENGWANCYLVDGTEYADDAKYVAYAPSSTNGWTKMIVVRDDAYASSFSGIWNRSQDITYNGYNYIVGTGWSDSKMTTNLNSFYSSDTPAMDESEYCVIVGGTTTASTNLPSSAVTYTSANTSVAEVGSSTGVITGVAAGSTTITAKVGSCTVGSATVTVYAAPSVSLSSSSVTYGGSAPTLTASNFATITGYSSSTTGTATINGSGVISIAAAGTTTFTVTGTDACGNAASITSSTFTVNKADISPSLSYSSTTLTYGGSNSSTPTITGNTGSGTVTYSVTASSPSGCITVNGSTGVVTPVAAGTGTVTATIGATTNYNGNTATADFTVNKATPTKFNFSVDKTVLCGDETATLTLADSEEGITYQLYSDSSTPIDDTEIAGTGDALVWEDLEAGSYRPYANANANYDKKEMGSNKITVSAGTTTSITTQPTDVTDATAGEETSLTVEAEGSSLTYQWKESSSQDGTYSNVASGGTSATYAVTPAAAGTTWYKCVVTGTCGTETTDAVKIVAAAAADPLVTWTMQINTSSGFSASSTSTTDGTNITSISSSRTGGGDKASTNCTNKVSMASAEVTTTASPSNYAAFTFTVNSAKKVVPKKIVCKVFNVSSGNRTYKAQIADSYGNVYNSTNTVAVSTEAELTDATFTFASDLFVMGDVQLRVYAWKTSGSPTEFRMGQDVKFYGTVGTAPVNALTWDFNGGACSETEGDDYTAEGDIRFGTDIVFPSNLSMSKPGYQFTGWSDGTSTYNEGDDYMMPDDDVEFTAQWESFELPNVSGLGVDDGATLSSIPLSWSIPGICDLSKVMEPFTPNGGDGVGSKDSYTYNYNAGEDYDDVYAVGDAPKWGQYGIGFPLPSPTSGFEWLSYEYKGKRADMSFWLGIYNKDNTGEVYNDHDNNQALDDDENWQESGKLYPDKYYWGNTISGSLTDKSITHIAIYVNSGDNGANNDVPVSVRNIRYHLSDQNDIDHIVLIRKEGSAATGIADPSATKLYEGTKSHYTDNSDVTGKAYYYTVFSVHSNGAVSTGASTHLTLYTITYNPGANGEGSIAAGKKTGGIDLTLSSSTFTRDDYTQDGWSTSDGGDKVYELGGTYTTDASTTLYPHWVVVSGPVITNGSPSNGTIAITSDGSTPILSAVSGSTVYIAATPSTGYSFTSWDVYKTGDASTKVATAASTASTSFTMPSYAVTVDATFSAKTYTITLNGNGGTGNTANVTATYNSSSLSSSITNPTLTGYIFGGWYSGSGGTGNLIINTSGVLQASVDGYTGAGGIWTKDATTTLYAKWTRDVKTAGWGEPWGATAIPSNTTSTVNGVILNATDITTGTLWGETSYNMGNGEAITINLPTGYYISAVSTSALFDSYGGNTNKLYIQFNSESTYDDSSYDLDDPIQLAGNCYDEWDNLGSATPVSVGSIPSGAQSAKIYCEGNSGSGDYLYRIIVEITAYDCTPYTVTFDGGDATLGSAPVDRPVCGEMTLPGSASLVYPGYLFDGWNDGTTDYDAGDTYDVTGNVTFTAQWVEDNTSLRIPGSVVTLNRTNDARTTGSDDSTIDIDGISGADDGINLSGNKYAEWDVYITPGKYDVKSTLCVDSWGIEANVTLIDPAGLEDPIEIYSTGHITGEQDVYIRKSVTETLDFTGLTANKRYVVRVEDAWDGGSHLRFKDIIFYPYHTITKSATNGSITTQVSSEDVTSAVQGTTVEIEATPSSGYEFTSWDVYKTGDASTKVATAASTASTSFTMPNYPVTVSATFTSTTFSVTYAAGVTLTSGSVPTDATAYDADDEVTVLGNTGSMVYTGYTFRGWTDGTTFFLPGQTFTITDNITLTAVWDNGASEDCTEYELLISSASLTREGSTTPKGDYITGVGMIMKNATGSSNPNSIGDAASTCHGSNKQLPTSSSTIGLRTYNAINKVTIYGLPTGKNRTISSIKTATDPSSFSSDIKSTCTLTENLNVSGECGETTVEFPSTLSANTYIEIIWNNNVNITGVLFENCVGSSYTVSFANMTGFGGSTTLPSTIAGVPSGKKLVQPADPTADGYTFGGWYSDAACTAGNEINWSTMTITADKTIYAKWCANHTVSWVVNGSAYSTGTPTTETTECDGIATMPTAPADNTLSGCANSFRGWSETNLYGEATNTQPADLFVTAADAPAITADKTFYAVFGTATGAAQVGTVLWSEDWTGESNNAEPSGPTTSGGYAIAGASISYAYTDGTGTNNSDTKVTTANGGNLAGGTSPELIVGYGTTTAGAFTVSGLPKKGAKELTLIFKRNHATTSALTASVSGDGYSISKVSGDKADTYVYIITCGSAETFNLTLTGSTTNGNNVRVDDIVLKVKTDGATNYRCICPSLTVTEKLVTASTPIFITSAAEKTVRSQDSLTIVGSGLKKNATLSISSPASKFVLKSRTNTALTTDATGAIEAIGYIYYTPGVGDTSDGLDKNNSFTITDGTNSETVSQALIGRHLPANFVIAAKSGDTWYALPADKTNGTQDPVEIEVDDDDDPTKAKTADANVFTLYGQTSSVISGGNGQYVKLAMHGQSNAPLKGDNNTGTGIGKGQGTVITNDQSEDYWWALTQTNTSVSSVTDVKYNLTVANANVKHLRIYSSKWGLYASGVDEIRLIPWNTPYSITYHLNGASWKNEGAAIYYNGEGYTLPVAGDMSNTGYTFGGWYANSDLSTGGVVTSIGTSEYGNKEYWAKWTENSYTITYNKNDNDATGSTSNTVGHYVTVADCGFELASNIFTGWNTAIDGSGASYAAGEEIELTADMTLYAQWASDFDVAWTITKIDSKLYRGGGGYTVTAVIDDASWDAVAADANKLELSATEGVTLRNITKSINGDSKAQITANFDITTDVAELATQISFTLSVPENNGYGAKDDVDEEDLDDCPSGGGGGSATWHYYFTKSADATTNGVTNASSIFTSVPASTGDASSALSFTIGGITLSSAKWGYKGQMSNGDELTTMVIPSGYTLTELQIAVNPGGSNLNIKVYNNAVTPEEVASSGVIANNNAEIATIDEELAAGTYHIKFTGRDCSRTYALAAQLTSAGTSGVDTELEWDDGALDIANEGVSKEVGDPDFTFTASADNNTLGAITYSSSDESVATVNATTGQVRIINAGNATITATLAASGCYEEASISYDIDVFGEACEDPFPTITTTDRECSGIELSVPSGSNGYQWYKDDAEIDGATDYTYTATEEGEYYVIVHNTCDRASNTVEIEAKGSVSASKIVDNWYVKNGRRTPDVALVQTTDATGFFVKIGDDKIWDEANDVTTGFGGCGFYLGEDGIIYLKGQKNDGTAPSGLSADKTLKITATGCSGNADELSINIKWQAATTRPSVAFVSLGTEKGAFTDTTAGYYKTTPLYKYLDYTLSGGAFDLTAQNIYSTVDEQALREHYSQFDAILITDDPNTGKKKDGKSYVDAMGALIDIRPMLTMEAFVSKLGNWKAKGINGNPTSPDPRQYGMKLECKDHEIFTGLSAGSSNVEVETIDGVDYWTVLMVDSTKSPYNGVAYNASTSDIPALQGFSASNVSGLMLLGEISDGALYAGVERQDEPAARLMLLGLNNKALPNALTAEGKRVISNALTYLCKTNMEDVDDCSNYFKGTVSGHETEWNQALNWSKGAVPTSPTVKVRILAPVELPESTTVRVHHVDIVVGGKSKEIAGTPNGSMTIPATSAMVVTGTVTRATAPYYGIEDLMPTEVNDIYIAATSTNNGTLILNNESGTTKATVAMYSKGGKVDGKKRYQYIGTPHSDVNNAQYNYYGSWLYEWTGTGWEKIKNGAAVKPWTGYCISYPTTGHTYVMEGTLVATTEKDIAVGADQNMVVGNSWTAPMYIKNFTDDDFENLVGNVYFFNTGVDADGSAENASTRYEASTYVTVPIHSSPYTGDSLISSMQGFFVKSNGSEGTLHLDYNRLVRPTGTRNVVSGEMHAPRRDKAESEEPDVLKLTVRGENYDDRLVLLQREDFSEGFDNGWDGDKWDGNNSSLYLYTPDEEGGDLSVSALPELEGTVVGFRAGEDNAYTIYFDYSNAEEPLYWYDADTRTYTRIVTGEGYQFFTNDKEKHTRFLITRTNGAQTPTGIEDGSGGDGVRAKKFILENKLFIMVNGKLYDATGKVVK